MNHSFGFKGLSGSTLKLIAIVTMLIDHTGATILRSIIRSESVMADSVQHVKWISIYKFSRDIGRIAFPIFCFLLVEGFLHTRNVRKYAQRLFLFALISEIPFDIALKGHWFFLQKQNVYFTLLIGLLVIACMDHLTFHLTQNLPLAAIPVIFGMRLALFMNTDYNYKGVFLIAVIYLMRYTKLYQCIAGAVAVSWENPAPLAFLPIYLYNGTRGRQMKYFFYWFYPVHLMILYLLSTFVLPFFF